MESWNRLHHSLMHLMIVTLTLHTFGCAGHGELRVLDKKNAVDLGGSNDFAIEVRGEVTLFSPDTRPSTCGNLILKLKNVTAQSVQLLQNGIIFYVEEDECRLPLTIDGIKNGRYWFRPRSPSTMMSCGDTTDLSVSFVNGVPDTLAIFYRIGVEVKVQEAHLQYKAGIPVIAFACSNEAEVKRLYETSFIRR